ncbi:MAG: Tad domain-containing protein [Pseudomonadota bacterium]
MFAKIIKNGVRFRNEYNGNIAMLFGLLLIPLVTAIGLAVDTSRVLYYGSALQEAADAAALRGAMAFNTGASVKTAAMAAFDANAIIKNELQDLNITVAEKTGGIVEIKATSKMKPIFMQVASFPNLNLSAESEAAFGGVEPIELTFMLDVTNSMGFGGARETAEQAISDLLEAMYAGDSSNENVFVSFVPYSDRINVGTHRIDWLDGAPPPQWGGCIEPRYEPEPGFPFALSDENPATLSFTPTDPTAMTEIDAYNEVYKCLDAIVGPTHERADIDNILNNYMKSGTGRIDLGLIWGWRLLSPKWSGYWGMSDYPSAHGDRRKIAIFITDGRSVMYCKEVNSYAPALPPEFSWCKNEISDEGFAHIEHTCNKMKNDGIEVFVLYVNGISRGAPYMENCASTDLFYSVNSLSEINDAFDNLKLGIIGDSIRLIK